VKGSVRFHGDSVFRAGTLAPREPKSRDLGAASSPRGFVGRESLTAPGFLRLGEWRGGVGDAEQ